eukprot:63601_1
MFVPVDTGRLLHKLGLTTNHKPDILIDELKYKAEHHPSEKGLKINTTLEQKKLTLFKYNLMLEQVKQKEQQGLYDMPMQVHADIISTNHMSNKNLSELTQIKISQLSVNQVHYGKFLRGKLVTQPFQMVCCLSIFEDDDENVIVLSLYNFASLQHSLESLLKLLPIGTEVIIKEPYCKKSTSGVIAIRIDNPHTNFIVIERNYSVCPMYIDSKSDADTLKISGNAAVKNKSYHTAIKCYTAALEIIAIGSRRSSMKMKLLSNRTLCFTQINSFRLALKDASNALNLITVDTPVNINVKIVYRVANILTSVGKHQAALLKLSEINSDFLRSDISLNDSILKLKMRIRRRYHESNHNEHVKLKKIKNIHEYLSTGFKVREFDKNKKRYFLNKDWRDIADYIGPIKLIHFPYKKRNGIIATQNIKRGTCILNERCVAFGETSYQCYSMVANHTNRILNKTKGLNLIQDMVDILSNGSIVDKYKITLLHPTHKHRKENVPSMSVLRGMINDIPKEIQSLSIEDIQNIETEESFSTFYKDYDGKLDGVQCNYCGLESYALLKACKRCKSVYYCCKSCQKRAWKQYHRNICKHVNNTNNKSKTKKIYKVGSGLYVLSSFVKFSMKPNLVLNIWNMRMSLTAIRNIRKGEELSVAYSRCYLG